MTSFEIIKTMIARLPTRQDLARIAFLAVFGGAALVITSVELVAIGVYRYQ
jgi:hypothetical protein